MNNFLGDQYPWLPRGPRPYHEGKDVGGAGSLVSFWTWPALVAACTCVRSSVRASASAGGWGRVRRALGSPLVVHRGQDAEEVAVGDRDARVLEPALLRPPRCPARLALLNLGLVVVVYQ